MRSRHRVRPAFSMPEPSPSTTSDVPARSLKARLQQLDDWWRHHHVAGSADAVLNLFVREADGVDHGGAHASIGEGLAEALLQGLAVRVAAGRDQERRNALVRGD